MVLAIKADAFSIRPIPWYTEEAIAFLEDFLKRVPDANILECGGGASTVWFGKRTRNLYTIEHSRKWQYILSCIFSETKGLCKPHFIFRKRPYFQVIEQFEEEFFDLIIVDGHHRKECIDLCKAKLKKGGTLMLDDAAREEYRSIFEELKEWPCTVTTQTKPDRCGHFERGKQTAWWTKLS